MADLYKVIFTGELTGDADPNNFVEQFAARFGCSVEKAQSLLDAGGEVVMKSGVDAEKADQYQRVLKGMGMAVRVEPVEPKASDMELEPMESEQTETSEQSPPPQSSCPKCGSDNIQDDNCLECGIIISKYLARYEGQELPRSEATVSETTVSNADTDEASNPYQAPAANLYEEVEEGELSGPNSVPFSHGWRWIAQGFGHFKQNPWSWILAIIVWIIIAVALNFVPIIGGIALTLISAIFTAGFMLGCKAQDEGEDFTINHLFSGFKQNTGQLLLIGVLYLVGTIVVVLGISMLVGGAAFMLMAGGDPAMMDESAMAAGMLLPMLIAMLFFIPLIMAYWFAPALVVLNGFSAITAMKMSFMGCLKNILPFLLYGIVAMVFFVIGALPVGLGLLVVMPMLTASLYTGYRDIYYA